MQKPPFFVVGVGRSGTTLIRLMLHNHPDIAIPYESHFITDYDKRISEYGDLKEQDNIKHLISDILDEELLKKWDHEFKLEKIFDMLDTHNLASVIDAIYMDYTLAKGKKRWGDKSDYLDRMHIINRLFPESKFIHIIRDGRDVSNSVMKLPWGPNDIIQAAEWWNFHVQLGRAMGQMLDTSRYMEVRYEDLVIDTGNQLHRICDFLECEYSDDMLNYYQNSSASIPNDRKGQHYNADAPPQKNRTYAWKKEMSTIDIAIFSDYAKSLLADLDYEIPTANVNKFYKLLRKILIYSSRFL